MNLIPLLYFIAALLLTVVGVEGWRRLAVRRQFFDVPNERSSHTRPTPSGGGVIIFLVTVSLLSWWSVQNGKLNEIAAFLAGAGLIAAVSYLDDLYNLPSLLRLAVHASGALIAIFGIGQFNRLEIPSFAGVEFHPLIAPVLTAVWIIGLTNAFNFMDGIDGIAGTQGLIAGGGWAAAGFLTGQPVLFLFGGLLAAANLGFLVHNWHPARIFMGDVGSAFQGYSLAVLPLLAARSEANGGRWATIGILFVWVFIFDAALTFARRAFKRENVLTAHRSHLYQRLIIAGLRHDRVALCYGILALVGATAALVWLANSEFQANRAVFAPVLLGAAGLWLLVRLVERRRRGRDG